MPLKQTRAQKRRAAKTRQNAALPAAPSRKERKRLEKVVLSRKLKVDRKNLLAELKQYQLQPGQLEQLHSTSSMQTKGLKKFLINRNQADHHKVDPIERAEQCLDAASLLKRKRRKIKSSANHVPSESSSEDTDAVSTDTEIYSFEDCGPSLPSNGVSNEPPAQKEDELASANDQPETRNSDEFGPTIIASNKPTRKKARLEPQPAVYVLVNRKPDVEEARLKLPIIGEEQKIVELIRYNDVVILSGETGSGKTTQLPQFLYEAGYALGDKLIGITEPRRVAAVSMSERVAHELNLTSQEVSYQIRFSGNVSSGTKIKFMTDGVLLRECQQDFLLTKYSVLIIDEAHERSVFSDILIGLLSRIVPMRSKRGDPLKLVIMSATMRVSDFVENSFLFKKQPPIINIDSRQFPVAMNFAKKTPRDYLHSAFKKVCSVHSKMPKGGILVFVTSQMDVKVLCSKLREKFPMSISAKVHEQTKGENTSRNKKTVLSSNSASDDPILGDLIDNFEIGSDEGDEFEFFDSVRKTTSFFDSDIDSSDDEVKVCSSRSPLYCLELYAMLPMEKQRLVFNEPPDGTRLCVIATNVAETSITIPNIKYVIDSGKEKTKVYDLITGVSRFVTSWTSKSSAEQRMGRAGRMGPGHCYRLYSSAVFANDFPEHATPRILQKPAEDILLQMKSMNIDNVVNFPFPTRPSIDALKAAEKKLILLGALDDSKIKNARYEDIDKTEFSSRPTPLGKAMARFAVSPRCSKMIVLSPHSLLPYVIYLVSALSVQEMFLEGEKWQEIRKKWSGHGSAKLLGDFMLMLRATIEANAFECSRRMCLKNGLRTKAMLEIDRLKNQLTSEINSNLTRYTVLKCHNLKKPDEKQTKALRQLLLSCFCDHVARKLPDGEIIKKCPNNPSKVIKKKLRNAYECVETKDPVYISTNSPLKREHHEFIIYKELYQGGKRTYMRDVAVIDAEWLPHFAYKLCNFSESNPLDRVPPKYDKTLDQIMCSRNTTFGSLNWPLGLVNVPMQLVESGVEIYKVFASFLLAGDVFDWFKKYTSKLLSPPSIMTKPWSKLQPRTSKLLQALVSRNLKSRKDLLLVWEEDQTVLLNEYLAWIPEALHHTVSQDWQNLVSLKIDH